MVPAGDLQSAILWTNCSTLAWGGQPRRAHGGGGHTCEGSKGEPSRRSNLRTRSPLDSRRQKPGKLNQTGLYCLEKDVIFLPNGGIWSQMSQQMSKHEYKTEKCPIYTLHTPSSNIKSTLYCHYTHTHYLTPLLESVPCWYFRYHAGIIRSAVHFMLSSLWA